MWNSCDVFSGENLRTLCKFSVHMKFMLDTIGCVHTVQLSNNSLYNLINNQSDPPLQSSAPYIIHPDCQMLRWRPLDLGDSLPCKLEGCELCTVAQLKSSVAGAICNTSWFYTSINPIISSWVKVWTKNAWMVQKNYGNQWFTLENSISHFQKLQFRILHPFYKNNLNFHNLQTDELSMKKKILSLNFLNCKSYCFQCHIKK